MTKKILLAGAGLAATAVIIGSGIVIGESSAEGASAESAVAADGPAAEGRLFFLNIRGQVLSAAVDGSDLQVLVDDLDTSPDGIVIDEANGHLYWSNMGAAKENDGSVIRSDLDGGNLTTIVPEGGTFTGKQLKLDAANGKLYWSDREGMRVQRVNLDGTELETLVEIASGDEARLDASNWAVGIAVDSERGHIYWSQKGGDNAGTGTIRRANIDIPAGETAANRSDIEVLFSNLPEPIDLDLDLANRVIYWTDRGNAPEGNNVVRAPMDPPAQFDAANRSDREILVENLDEGIGISLDLPGNRMYVTDLRGNLYSAALDGSDRTVLGTGLGSLTGIAFMEAAAWGAREGS